MSYILTSLMLSGLAYVMFDTHQLRQRVARQSQQTAVAVVDAAIARSRARPIEGGDEDSVDGFFRRLRLFFEVARENADIINRLPAASLQANGV